MRQNFVTILRHIVFALALISPHAYAIDKMPSHLAELQSLSNTELQELYTYGTAYSIPSSDKPSVEQLLIGIALPVPGYEGPSELLGFFWGGKIFTTDQVGKTSLSNQILPNTPVSLNNVKANVRIKENSLTIDGEAVIFINYQNSNIRLARSIRDEIRLIAPNLYLGRAYRKNDFITRLLTRKEHSFLLWFALEYIE